jgi:LPXTG-motif cell wall-anchored protein
MSTPSEAKPSILDPDNFKRVAKTKMAWQILILFAAVFLVLIVVLRNNVNSIYAYMGALLITGVGMLYLYKKKNPDVLFTFAAISGSTLAQISTWLVLEASHYANFLWIVICSIIVYLGAYRRVGNIILFFNALGVGYFIYYVRNEQIAFARPLTNLELTSLYLELLLGFVVLGYFMYQFVSFQKMWEKAYIDINHSLENQNATITYRFNLKFAQ